MADQRLVGGLHREEQGCSETAQRGKDFLSHRRQPSSRWTSQTNLFGPRDGGGRCGGDGYANKRGRHTDRDDNGTIGWRGRNQILRRQDSTLKLRGGLEGPDRHGDGELQDYATGFR